MVEYCEYLQVSFYCVDNSDIIPAVFGNKTEEPDNSPVIVGDNCYFGLGCKIFGNGRIGNNVTVGAGAVVVKDVPDNAVVVGNPARIIKYNKPLKI